MRRHALLLGTSLLAALLHCADSHDTTSQSGGAGGLGGSGGSPPAGAADYCESIVDSFCEFYVRCGRMAVTHVEDCRAPFLETCNASYETRYIALESAGLLSLDADGLAACATHLSQVACERQIFELTGPCADVWRGHQPAGGTCGLDVESFVCDPSSACVLGLDLCGECRVAADLGGDCSASDTTCRADAFCDGGTCRARAPIGGACGAEDRCVLGAGCDGGTCVGPTFVGVGDTCDNGRRCPYLSACMGGTCTRTALIGEPCAEDALCESGLCGSSGSCEPPRGEGEPCMMGSHCASGSCDGQSCQPLPSACIAP